MYEISEKSISLDIEGKVLDTLGFLPDGFAAYHGLPVELFEEDENEADLLLGHFAELAYSVSEFAHTFPELFQAMIEFEDEIFFHYDPNDIFNIDDDFPSGISANENEYYDISVFTVISEEPVTFNGKTFGNESVVGFQIEAENNSCFSFLISQILRISDMITTFEEAVDELNDIGIDIKAS